MTKEKKPILEEGGSLIRIVGQDIPGSKGVYAGLTKIKGVSWVVSNLLCKKLGIKKNLKISELKKSDVERIEKFLKALDAPDFLKNRRMDFDTGKSLHLVGVDLDMRKDFDIKRLKQIKSYRGLRHSLKLPVRGQRTKSNFRKSGIAVGVKRPKIGKKS